MCLAGGQRAGGGALRNIAQRKSFARLLAMQGVSCRSSAASPPPQHVCTPLPALAGVPPRWQLLKQRLEAICPSGTDTLQQLWRWRSVPKHQPPFLLQARVCTHAERAAGAAALSDSGRGMQPAALLPLRLLLRSLLLRASILTCALCDSQLPIHRRWLAMIGRACCTRCRMRSGRATPRWVVGYEGACCRAASAGAAPLQLLWRPAGPLLSTLLCYCCCPRCSRRTSQRPPPVRSPTCSGCTTIATSCLRTTACWRCATASRAPWDPTQVSCLPIVSGWHRGG